MTDPRDLTVPPEQRIVAELRERRRSGSLAAVPFVAPATLLGIARRAGVHVEDIGGASVRIYTELGWARIYERHGIGDDVVLFDYEPSGDDRTDSERIVDKLDDIRDLLRVISRRR